MAVEASPSGPKSGALLVTAGAIAVGVICFTCAPRGKIFPEPASRNHVSADVPALPRTRLSLPLSAAIKSDSNISVPTRITGAAPEVTAFATPRAELESPLPPPPSGDYELSLSPEQLANLVDQRYGDFLVSLVLPPDRLAQLRALLTERQQITIDAANAAVVNGADPVRDVAVIEAATREVQISMDQTLRDTFGQTIFNAYQEAERRRPAKNSVKDLARHLANSPEPLTPDQTAQLLQLFGSGTGVPSAPDATRAIFGNLTTRAQLSPSAATTASHFLSRQQLGALESLNLLAKEPDRSPDQRQR